ncbi:MAG: transcription elongation factor GreA [Chitinophagaceae bacterium]|nr:transcription elongation factor GreA [Chitinophagaceae bacterium]HMN33171.1 transcription elongation factor GreA [Chitinophagaceae bacterium]
MSNITYVTKETLDQMIAELNQLKSSGRAEIAKAIAEAREKGDLKENAEYDAAKEAQGHHEAKIAVLESAIVNARIIDKSNIDTSKVTILSKVKMINLKTKKHFEYQIVSENEADIKQSKISVLSPIGKGLLGKKIGEIADVITPGGLIQFKIENISI